MTVRSRIIGIITLVWVILLLSAALARDSHADLLYWMGMRLWTLVEWGAFTGVLALTGLRLLRRLAPALDFPASAALAAGLGLGLLSLYMFALGCLGWLNVWAVLAFPAMSAILGHRQIRRLLQDLGDRAARVREGTYSLGTVILGGGVLLTAGLYLAGAFTPVIDYDALEYHLALPDLYLKAGRMGAIPHNVYSHFPLNIEMLYLAALVLGRPEWVKLFNVLFVLLTAALCYAYARRWAGGHAGFLAALVWLCSGHLAVLAWQGKSDAGHAFFCAAAVLVLMDGFATRSRAVLGGLFAGLALGSKISAVFFVWGALGFSALVQALVNRDFGKTSFNMMTFLAVSILVACPWWMKNFIETGDPFFPLGSWIFHSDAWLPYQYAQWRLYHAPAGKGFWDWIAFLKRWISGEQNFLPAFLLGFPLALSSMREPKTRFCLIYALLGFAFTATMTVGDPRFFLPLFPILAVVVSVCVVRRLEPSWLRPALQLVMALYIIWNLALVGAVLDALDAPKVLAGLVSKSEYLRSRLPHYKALEFLNQRLDPTAKVLFLGEARTLYMDRAALASTVFDCPAVVAFLEGARDDGEILHRFSQAGITHLAVNPMEIRRWDRSVPGWSREVQWDRLKTFLRHSATVIYQDPKSGIQIFQFKTASRRRNPT